MTATEPTPAQFSLTDDGLIRFQPDPTNPLPGEPIAKAVKGEAYLKPGIELLPIFKDGAETVLEKLNIWIHLHIAKVLEPLVRLTAGEDTLPEPVRDICRAVHAGLGVLPRADVADAIAKLDNDMRKTLRERHVRLGPVLIFIPDLTKPAAVRLRAVLWSLHHDKPLPAPVPRNGSVSTIIDPAVADAAFHQAIGYPIYANRAIRIDMLDRVISSVYDNAKDGHFQAQHKMAEWLGCSIPDLYAVLEAMGHKKVSDPAEKIAADAAAAEVMKALPAENAEAAEQTNSEPATETAPPVEETKTEVPAAEVTSSETQGAEPPAADAKPAPQIKPELATFKIWWPRKNTPRPHFRREGQEGEAPAGDRPPRRARRTEKDGEGERKFGGDRPFQRKNAGGADRPDRGDRPQHRERKRKTTKTDKQMRVISSGPKPKAEDSPFAALAALKFSEK